MPCPRCGYDLASVNAPACPNCGLPLVQSPAYPPAAYPGAPSTPLYSQGSSQPAQPVSGEVPPSMPSGWPGYGTAPNFPTNPASPGLPPYPTAPGYAVGAPPSVPLAPGQAYPQAWYGQPGVPSQQLGSPFGPPAPRRRAGLVIGVVLAIVLILGASGAAVVALNNGGSPAASATATATGTTGPTATPTATVIYQESFASQPEGWSEDANCFYGTGGYHIKNGYFCFARSVSSLT